MVRKGGFSVKVACPSTRWVEWFDSTLPLKVIEIKSETAMKFRKRFLRGFLIPGSNNFYLGVVLGDTLFGVLGFSNPDYGNYDILIKADTTPSMWDKSTDLLLFALRTKDVKILLEKKFNRKVETAYTKTFTKNGTVARYRKHADLVTKEEIKESGEIVGYEVGYKFTLGQLPSLKEAKMQFIQKSWKK